MAIKEKEKKIMENEIKKLIEIMDMGYKILKRVPTYYSEYDTISRKYRYRNYQNTEELLEEIRKDTNYSEAYYQISRGFDKLIEIVETKSEYSREIMKAFQQSENVPFEIERPTTKFMLQYLKQHCIDHIAFPFEELYNINTEALYELSSCQTYETLCEWGLLETPIQYFNSLTTSLKENRKDIDSTTGVYYKYLSYFNDIEQVELYGCIINAWDFKDHMNLLEKLQYIKRINIKANTNYSGENKYRKTLDCKNFDKTISYFEQVSSPITLQNYFIITRLYNNYNDENQKVMERLFRILIDQKFPNDLDLSSSISFENIFINFSKDDELKEKLENIPEIESFSDMSNTFNRLARIYGYKNPFENCIFFINNHNFNKREIANISADKIKYLLNIENNNDFEYGCLLMQLPELTDQKEFIDTFLTLDHDKKAQIMQEILKDAMSNKCSFGSAMSLVPFGKVEKRCEVSLGLMLIDKIFEIDLSNEIDSILGRIGKFIIKKRLELVANMILEEEDRDLVIKDFDKKFNMIRKKLW